MSTNKIQAACLVALLSSCSVVSDFDFVEGDGGMRDAAEDVATLDAPRRDAPGRDARGLDAPELDVPDVPPPPPLVLSALSLEADGTSVAFDTAFSADSFAYDGEVGLFVREVTLVATTDLMDTTLRVAGVEVMSGEATPVELALGDNLVSVELTRGDEVVTYMLNVDRDDDPLQNQYIKAGITTQAYAEFGRSVAMAGDLLVIGAGSEQIGATSAAGVVYIFRRDAEAWNLEDRLQLVGPMMNDRFGTTVATDGALVVVGAPAENGGRGAVYIFNETGAANWTQTERITQEAPASDDLFGSSIAVEGRRLAVGAPGAEAVYTFALAGDWGPVQTIRAPTGVPADSQFGNAVVMRENTLAIGASGEDSNGSGVDPAVMGTSMESGAVFVYSLVGASWESPTYLKAFGPQVDDAFGSSIAFDGDLLAVGATEEDGGSAGVGTVDDSGVGSSDSGAVYTFQRDAAGVWTAGNYIKAESPRVNAGFGTSVSIWGNLLVIGAPRDNVDDVTASGGASLYTHGSSGWSFETLRVAPRTEDLAPRDKYGTSLGISMHGVVVGSWGEDGDGSGPTNEDAVNSGAAYSLAPAPR